MSLSSVRVGSEMYDYFEAEEVVTVVDGIRRTHAVKFDTENKTIAVRIGTPRHIIAEALCAMVTAECRRQILHPILFDGMNSRPEILADQADPPPA